MVKAEQFAYYIPGLTKILEERDLEFFGLDINCRFEKYFLREHKEYAKSKTIFVTGELQGSGHILSSHRQFLSLLKKGCGRGIF